MVQDLFEEFISPITFYCNKMVSEFELKHVNHRETNAYRVKVRPPLVHGSFGHRSKLLAKKL